MEECHLLLTDQVDLVNPKGHRVVPDVRKPLPLGGPPGQQAEGGNLQRRRNALEEDVRQETKFNPRRGKQEFGLRTDRRRGARKEFRDAWIEQKKQVLGVIFRSARSVVGGRLIECLDYDYLRELD
ncbi:hypothetical protein Tco_0010111 [Tanacetum coccineum]